jgi:hypothetical protein
MGQKLITFSPLFIRVIKVIDFLLLATFYVFVFSIVEAGSQPNGKVEMLTHCT